MPTCSCVRTCVSESWCLWLERPSFSHGWLTPCSGLQCHQPTGPPSPQDSADEREKALAGSGWQDDEDLEAAAAAAAAARRAKKQAAADAPNLGGGGMGLAEPMAGAMMHHHLPPSCPPILSHIPSPFLFPCTPRPSLFLLLFCLASPPSLLSARRLPSLSCPSALLHCRRLVLLPCVPILN